MDSLTTASTSCDDHAAYDSAAATAAAMSAAEEYNLHLSCAQELNNSAAMYFEKGLYEQATFSLHNGIKLLINMNHPKHQQATSSCCGSCSEICLPQQQGYFDSNCDHPCTLDGCIAFSEQTSFLFQCNSGNTTKTSKRSVFHNNGQGPSNSRSHKKRRLSCSKDVSSGLEPLSPEQGATDANPDTEQSFQKKFDGYVYRRPIRVPLGGFCHCQTGYTFLLVVITFNLAIAHHLNAMKKSEAQSQSQFQSAEAAKNEAMWEVEVRAIVSLYKLCLEFLHQNFSSSKTGTATGTTTSAAGSANAKTSIRCEMIIHNNLSQLYRMNGNPDKHEKSLQDLLSSLMVLIERQTRESGGNGNSNGNSGSSSSGYWWDRRQNGEQSELVEGVLENLDSLTLREHCADAA